MYPERIPIIEVEKIEGLSDEQMERLTTVLLKKVSLSLSLTLHLLGQALNTQGLG